MKSTDWETRASCRGMDTLLWFPPHESDTAYAAARTVCCRCPVRAECLEAALERGDVYGMFGGLTPGERDSLRGKTPAPPWTTKVGEKRVLTCIACSGNAERTPLPGCNDPRHESRYRSKIRWQKHATRRAQYRVSNR